MPIRLILFSLLLLLFLSAAAGHAQDMFTIHYPPDRIIKEHSILGVSFSVAEGAADKVVVRVNTNKFQELSTFKKIHCFSVQLKYGKNTIEFQALKDGTIIDNVTRHVFFRSDLIAAYKQSPSDYRRDFFHTDKRELCAECHVLDPTDADRKPLNVTVLDGDISMEEKSRTTSTCYSCHKGLLSYPFVHGPVSVWSCLNCHDENSKPRYEVPGPDSEICFKCHLDKKKLWLTKKHKHGPVTLGKCTICHSPHSAEYAFNLYKKTWDLCVNCHSDMASGRHILGDSFSKVGHPTKDTEDPIRVGKKLSCASCHDPHASDVPHLWAFEVDSLFDLCQKCHQKKMN